MCIRDSHSSNRSPRASSGLRGATRIAVAARALTRVASRVLGEDRGRSSDLTFAAYNPFETRQFAKSHRSSRVQLLGRDAHFTAQTKFATVNESRRGVDEHGRGIDTTNPRFRAGDVLGDDCFTVTGAVEMCIRDSY